MHFLLCIFRLTFDFVQSDGVKVLVERTHHTFRNQFSFGTQLHILHFFKFVCASDDLSLGEESAVACVFDRLKNDPTIWF